VTLCWLLCYKRVNSRQVSSIGNLRCEFGIPHAQGFLDAIAQSFARERFWKEMVRAGIERVRAWDFSTHGRDENDGDARRGRIAAKDFADGKPVNIGQAHVEQDEVRRLTPNEVKPLLSGFSGQNFEACPLQVI
jgi:hypothetical protein